MPTPNLRNLYVQIPTELYDALNAVVAKRRAEDHFTHCWLRDVVTAYLVAGVMNEMPEALEDALEDSRWPERLNAANERNCDCT